MLYRNFREKKDEKQNKGLKNSVELDLTPEKLEILNLYAELRKKDEEIKDLKDKYGKLEDQLFDRALGFEETRKLEKITSEAPKVGLMDKVGNFLLLAYMAYILLNNFFLGEKLRKRR